MQVTDRVCIVTPNLPGVHIGTDLGWDVLALARAIAGQVGQVILLTPYAPNAGVSVSQVRKKFSGDGITVECLFWPNGSESRASFGIHSWLNRTHFDQIIFADSEGLGYWALNARNQGLSYTETAMSIFASAPTELVYEAESRYWTGPEILQRLFMERQCAALADGLLGLCQSILDYYNHKSKSKIISQDLLPFARETQPPTCASNEVDTIVFAGILSERNGLLVFCEALKRLNLMRMREGIKTRAPTVLVTSEWSNLPNGDDGLARFMYECRNWPGEIEFCQSLGPEALLSTAIARNAVVVSSSQLTAKSPLVLAAQRHGLRWVTSDLHAGVTELTLKIAAHLKQRKLEADITESDTVIPSQNLLDDFKFDMVPMQSTSSDYVPLVSVCISYFDRPVLLEQALQSLREQTYPNLEVIVIDDASPSVASQEFTASLKGDFHERGWKLVRNESEMWQSVSRNKAVSLASGEYVLIMDDDNLAHPEEVKTLVNVALRTGADVVWCFQNLFEGDSVPDLSLNRARIEFFPVGPFAAIGPIWNTSGDVNALFKKSTFEALGGYSARIGVGCEDFEMGVKVALQKIPWAVVPQALYGYRFSSAQMAKKLMNLSLYLSHRRAIEPYADHLIAGFHQLPSLANDMFYTEWQTKGGAYWTQYVKEQGSVFEDAARDNPVYDEFYFIYAKALREIGQNKAAYRVLSNLFSHHKRDNRIAEAMAYCAIDCGYLSVTDRVLNDTDFDKDVRESLEARLCQKRSELLYEELSEQ